MLSINVTDFVKVLLKPRLKVGREMVSKAQNIEQVRNCWCPCRGKPCWIVCLRARHKNWRSAGYLQIILL